MTDPSNYGTDTLRNRFFYYFIYFFSYSEGMDCKSTPSTYLPVYIPLHFCFPLIFCLSQVGMFVCGGPVKVLEVNPRDPREFVCGDTQGQLYFLSWTG